MCGIWRSLRWVWENWLHCACVKRINPAECREPRQRSCAMSCKSVSEEDDEKLLCAAASGIRCRCETSSRRKIDRPQPKWPVYDSNNFVPTKETVKRPTWSNVLAAVKVFFFPSDLLEDGVRLQTKQGFLRAVFADRRAVSTIVPDLLFQKKNTRIKEG